MMSQTLISCDRADAKERGWVCSLGRGEPPPHHILASFASRLITTRLVPRKSQFVHAYLLCNHVQRQRTASSNSASEDLCMTHLRAHATTHALLRFWQMKVILRVRIVYQGVFGTLIFRSAASTAISVRCGRARTAFLRWSFRVVLVERRHAVV